MIKLHNIKYYLRDGVWYYKEDDSVVDNDVLTRTLNTIYFEGNHCQKNY